MFLCGFFTPLLEEVFFPNITLLRLHVKIQFDPIVSDLLMEKLKKQSPTQKTGLNFEFLLGRTSGAIKPAQGNCMMITSSMCPIQLFQTRFQLYCRHENSNSYCKEEHLKCNRGWNVFLAHFIMDPDLQSPVHNLKNLGRSLRWWTDLNRSNLQNLFTWCQQ